MKLLTLAALVLLLVPSSAWAPTFMADPTVRVDPNVQVEFEWRTDVTWFGHVAVYDNPDGTGAPVAERRDNGPFDIDPVSANQHTVVLNADGAPLAPDTRYFFKITATDPTGSEPSFSTPTPLPSFFTGAQAIGDVSVVPGTDTALVSWDANVIGLGRVEILSPAGPAPVDDALNTTDHSIELTGLEPGTTYEFRVSNRHALDGDSLAAKTGSFTTQSPDSTPPTINLTTPPEGAVYLLNQTVSADYACQDEADGTGLASCLGDLAAGAPIDTAAAGAKTFTVTAADNAGNASSVTHSYSVVYSFSGFLAPLRGAPAVNAGKAGRTYAVRWQLRDANGDFVSALGAAVALVVQPTSCSDFTSDPADAEEAATTGGTSLRYDDDANQYVYNWATPGPGCYTLFLQLDSGQVFPAFFNLS